MTFFWTIGNELHRPSCLLFSIMKIIAIHTKWFFIHLILDKRKENTKHTDVITVQSLPPIYNFTLSLLQSSSPLITASNSLNILAPYLLLGRYLTVSTSLIISNFNIRVTFYNTFWASPGFLMPSPSDLICHISSILTATTTDTTVTVNIPLPPSHFQHLLIWIQVSIFPVYSLFFPK